MIGRRSDWREAPTTVAGPDAAQSAHSPDSDLTKPILAATPIPTSAPSTPTPAPESPLAPSSVTAASPGGPGRQRAAAPLPEASPGCPDMQLASWAALGWSSAAGRRRSDADRRAELWPGQWWRARPRQAARHSGASRPLDRQPQTKRGSDRTEETMVKTSLERRQNRKNA